MPLWLWLLGALFVGGAIVLTLDYLDKKVLINKIKEILFGEGIQAKRLEMDIKQKYQSGDYNVLKLGLKATTEYGEIIERDIEVNAYEVSDEIQEGRVIVATF